MHIRDLLTGRKPIRLWQYTAIALILIVAISVIALDMTGERVGEKSIVKSKNAAPASYGIAVGDSVASASHAERMRILSNIKKAGFTQVRINLDWSAVQAVSAKTYNWKSSDSMMKDIRTSGLTMIVTLDRTPSWARETTCKNGIFCPPAQAQDFAHFAGTAVSRYKSYPIDAWEIWNEQNINNFWKPQPNIPAYAALLKASYKTIKQESPSAMVLVGGLAGNALDSNGVGYIDPRTYLTDLYTSGAGDSFDGVAYHPYTGLRLPTAPSDYNGWLKMAQTNPSIRSIMVAHGDHEKGIWLTEFGTPTNGSGNAAASISAKSHAKNTNHVTPTDQASIAKAALEETKRSPWIKSFDWYTYTDNRYDPESSGGSFGLIQANGEPKPAYYIFKNFLR